MAQWTIYGSDNQAKAVVKELELHDEWMAECFLTVTVKSAEPIDFAIGDYIDYRGERYTIQYDPNVIKRARRGSYGDGFTYDNIKFLGLQDEVVRCDFNDIVLSDNNVHYTALPTFPFYCESVDDLLDRIQANLEDLYPGQWTIIGLNTVRNYQRGLAVDRAQAFMDAYEQYIDPTGAARTEPYGKQSVAETVDQITCWDAMKKVHDDFELNFIVRGRVIIVGTAGTFTANTFRYGKGNGLYEIERIGESDQQIITRLRAYGSDQNLPQHYYATMNKRVYATITKLRNKFGTQGAEFIIDLNFDRKYFTYQSESFPTTGDYPNYIVTISANDISVRAYVTHDTYSGNCRVYCEYTGGVDDRDEPNASNMAAFVTALSNGDRVYFTDFVKKETFGDGHYDYATPNLPDNMAVSKLMMPGFPNQSLHDWVEAHKNLSGYDWLAQAVEEGFTFSNDQYRPYIDSPNITEYGIRPGSIIFDGTNDTDDIRPTIEGMTVGNVPVDEIYAADQVDDNGVYPAGEEVKNINITLPALGFELDKVFEDGASIDMKDGMCGARSFKIDGTPKKTPEGRWVCSVNRVHDESLDLWFPYEDFQIHGSSESGRDHGDKYVLIGITMPDAYIEFAAVKLLRAAIEALRKNHAPRQTFQPRIDEIWMQRQHDDSQDGDVVSLHDTLKAGDIFSFADDDLGIDASIIIDILTIKENGNKGIPTYEITLRDEKQVNTIQKITNKIDSVFSSSVNGVGTGGMTPQQVQSLISKEGRDYFLSKIDDDTAKGNMTFEKNVTIGGRQTVNEVQSSEYTGDGMLDTGFRLFYEEGRAKLVIDDLVARGKFTANQLETRIWTYAGGNMVFSGAGSTIFFVEYLDANENPLGYTYINQPWLLRGRALLAGGLSWSKRKAIQRELTDAEKAQVVKFRCYEYSDDGTMQTRNWWQPNDIAMCETLNKVRDKANSDGSYSGSASNTVYKRRVAGIGSKEIPMLNDGRIYDYVDMWNIYDVYGQTYIDSQGHTATITDSVKGYDSTYHDWPAAGDVIVQMGNPLDTDRQAAVTIEVQGDVHGFKVYDTISDYSMDNNLWVELGYDKKTGKAKADVFGDFRFGCRESEEAQGGSYVKYNRTTKQLDIRANVRFESPISHQETTLDSFASAVAGDLTNLQNQIDGQIESWFYNYSPVHVDSEGVPDSNVPLNVAPYSDWTTDALKIAHLGDTFTNNETGYCWRFSRNATTNAFEWVIIEDSAVIKALQDAARAQDTADHKRRTFVLPVTIDGVTYNYPYPPYDVGDMWVNATYPTTGTKTYDNDLLKCTTSQPATGSFDISHWDKASKYTDDTTVNYIISRYGQIMNIPNPTADNVGEALGHLREVLKGTVDVDGGLVLANAIYMKGTESTPLIHGGISGVYHTNETGTGYKGHGTAAWFGGGVLNGVPIDHEVTTNPSLDYAKILFRMDGTGYLAGGKISWDTNGNGHVAGGNVAWTTNAQGTTTVTINGATVQNAPSIATNSLTVGSVDVAAALNTLLSMFELDSNGDIKTKDYTVNGEVHHRGFWSPSFISALGQGTGGGGGGATALYQLVDVELTNPANGQGLVYNGTKWVNSNIVASIPQATNSTLGGFMTGYNDPTAGTRNYAVQIDDGKAFVNVPWTDTTNFLPLTGGTLTGETTFNNDCWHLAANESNVISNKQWNNSTLYNNANTAVLGTNYAIRNAIRFKWYNTYWNIGNIRDGADGTAGFGIALEDTTNNRLIDCFRVTSSAAYVAGNEVIHVGNIGSQTVGYSTTSGTATYANSAGSAQSAGYATSAGSAGSATTAGSAGSATYAGYITDGTMDLIAQNDNEINFGGTTAGDTIYFGYRARGNKVAPTGYVFGSYDGTANLTFHYAYVNEIRSKTVNNVLQTLHIGSSGGVVQVHGNMGIGISQPSYKLHVGGDIAATGGISGLTASNTSDIRKKNIKSYEIPLTVEQIAKAPTILFTWKEKPQLGMQVGSTAQYWQKVLPQSITIGKDKEQTLGLQYGNAALVAVTKVAQKVVDHDKLLQEQAKKISELEDKCANLKKENEWLKRKIA